MPGLRPSLLALVPCLLAAWSWPVLAQRLPIPVTLEGMAREGNFEVTGLDKVQDASGRSEPGDLYTRLRALLEDFNHVIVQAPGGGVAKVIVISRKTAYTPPPLAQTPEGEGEPAEEQPTGEIELDTERRGTSHLVTLALEGEGGKRSMQTLTVDTGADFVVLPVSLLGPLGIQAQKLQSREVQTANGKTSAKIGRLPAIWFGEHKLKDVQAAFIDDAKLGGNGLLGMSVLGRYRMTIDDEANRLTLSPK